MQFAVLCSSLEQNIFLDVKAIIADITTLTDIKPDKDQHQHGIN